MNIPPLDTEEQALALPEVAEVYAKARESSLPGAMSSGNLTVLLTALHDGGVELGAFDAREAAWLAGWEPVKVAAVAGWIGRAYEAGLAAREGDEDG